MSDILVERKECSMKREPILTIIQKALNTKGRLDSDFSLPKENEDDLSFVDGAIDGIGLYHGGMEQAGLSIVIQAIDLVLDGEYKQALRLTEQFARSGHTLCIIDEVQQYITEQQDRLDAADMQRFALDLMVYGTLREQVKLGMAIMEMFDLEEEGQYLKIIRDLSCSDEFTLYGTFLARTLENANEELYAMAKKVTGWGKIHVVRELEPEYDEMEEWFLEEGVQNQIQPEYSAFDCFEKSQMRRRLKAPMTQKQFNGACQIMHALILEGPVEGISQVKDAKEVIASFVEQAKRQMPDKEQQEIIGHVIDFATEHGFTI